MVGILYHTWMVWDTISMGVIEVFGGFCDFADLCDGSRRQGFFLEDIEEVVDFQTQILSATVVTVKIYTLPKTKMFPENWWLEDVFPIEIVPF